MSTLRRVVDIIGRVLIGLGVLCSCSRRTRSGAPRSRRPTPSPGCAPAPAETSNDAIKRALAEESALDKLPDRSAGPRADHRRPGRGRAVGDIRIPVIGINQVVVEGTNTPDLRKGPGHYTGTPLPGPDRQRCHRRPPDHLRAPLLQPRLGKGRRPDRPDHAAGHLRLRHHQELRRVAQRHDASSTTSDREPAHADHLQSALQRHDTPHRSGQARTLAAVPELWLARAPLHSDPKSQSLAGDSDASLTTTLLWGFATALVVTGIFLAAWRFRRQRWVIYGVGALGTLVLLWFFFGAISPLLPASF